jgi:hypothetical protein
MNPQETEATRPLHPGKPGGGKTAQMLRAMERAKAESGLLWVVDNDRDAPTSKEDQT